MNWCRSRIRSLALLAMFALAVQMVLSFGHMHRDDLGLPPQPMSGETQVTSDMTPAPSQPAGRDHHPGSDDYCPICASMALIATALPSLPPMLIEPMPIGHVRVSETSVRLSVPQVARPFRARAPPLA